MTPGATFDRWVGRGPFTASDLGIFRIVYAGCALLLLPRPEAYSALPDFLWSPPPGPLRLLDPAPPHGLLVTLSILEALSLGFLLVGLFTRSASITAGLTFVAADGVANSHGTIYHYILLGLVPLVVVWAGWGTAYSLDTRRRAHHRAGPADPVRQWPLRFLALCVGVAFATAGIAKLRGGWLDTSTQAARGHFISGYLTQGRDAMLAPAAARVDSHLLWETLDWLTVALELAVLVSVVSWRWFRPMLLVVMTFHLVVLLVLNIAFAANVVAYGAFVRWSHHLPEQTTGRLPRGVLVACLAGSSVAGLVVTEVMSPRADFWVRALIVAVGSAGAVLLTVRPRPPRPSSG